METRTLGNDILLTVPGTSAYSPVAYCRGSTSACTSIIRALDLSRRYWQKVCSVLAPSWQLSMHFFGAGSCSLGAQHFQMDRAT